MFLAKPSRSQIGIAAAATAILAPAAQAADKSADNQQFALASELANPALDAIIVIATRAATAINRAPASVTLIAGDALHERALLRLGDALQDVPGLYIRGAALGPNYPGTGQAVLSLRGIPRTPRTLVMLDGQPLNNALSGGVNVAGIPFDSIARVEVVRGPYSALYGGNAMGGVVNFISASPDDEALRLRVGIGTDFQRSAALAYRHRYANGLGVTLSLSWDASDGYGAGDPVLKRAGRGSAGLAVSGVTATTTPDAQPRFLVGTTGPRPWWQGNGQLAFHYAPNAHLALVAGVGWAQYSVHYARPRSFVRDASGAPIFAGAVVANVDGAPVALSLAESDFLTLTPSGERDLRAFLRAEQRLGDSTLRLNVGTLRHSFRYAQAKSGVAGYDHGPGELTDQPNTRIDADLSLHAPLAAGTTLTAGVGFSRQSMDRETRALANWRDQGDAGAQLTAGTGRSTNLSAFAQIEQQLGASLRAYAGGRFDHFETSGRVVDIGPPLFDESYARRRFRQFSPKLAAVWQPAAWLSLHASYGAGFRPPALLDMYSRTVPPTVTAGVVSVILPAPDLRPERVRAFEIGASVALSDGSTLSVAGYRQRLSDLIYRQSLTPDGTLSRNNNAGAAAIDGIEANASWQTPLAGLRLAGTLTHQFRYEITRNEAAPLTVGKVLTDVPQTMWSATLDYARGPWAAFLTARHTAHVYGSGNDMNTNRIQQVFGSYDANTILSARLSRVIDDRLTLAISGDNLLNHQYYIYAKQPGRTLRAEATFDF